MINVYVVTNIELGWDNIIGVFLENLKEELEHRFKKECGYIIFKEEIQTDLTIYE